MNRDVGGFVFWKEKIFSISKIPLSPFPIMTTSVLEAENHPQHILGALTIPTRFVFKYLPLCTIAKLAY